MISRVADHCFWLGRHVERVESTARVLAVTRSLSLDAGLTAAQCWWPVVVVSGEEATFRRRFGDELRDGEGVEWYLTWDDETQSAIRSTSRAARENARVVRDVLSQDVWEALNELHLWLAGEEGEWCWRDDRHGFYRRVLRTCQHVHGLVHDSMLQEDAFEFILLGKMLERAGQTARLLDVHHHAFARLSSPRILQAEVSLSLLQACSGFEPFMKRNRGPVTPEAIAGFLALDPAFPRSIHFAVASAHRVLAELRSAADPGGAAAGDSLARLGALRAWLAAAPQASVEPSALHDTLTKVVDETAEICDAIGLELLGQAPAAPPAEALQ
jgi:uncharacterized alpha-E superfamily protein